MSWRWALPVAGMPLAITALLLGLGLADAPAGPEADSSARSAAPQQEVGSWTGSGRCGNRGCHGGVDVVGTLGTEYNTWINLDQHARAFEVLFNDVSGAIQERLRAKVEAHQDDNCLSCHGPSHHTRNAGKTPPQAEPMPIGIGCESCHGPAGGWLIDHYKPDWKDRSDDRKAKQGLETLSTASQRAELCARCHVGENLERQVHHDLIAAGHPRLNFEFSSFMARMPRHWVASATEPPETQNWAVGQAVALRSTIQLLEQRAAAAVNDQARLAKFLEANPKPVKFPEPSQPWPEFTEYSCFACHHDLRDTGIRYTGITTGRSPGSLAWNTWMLPMATALAKHQEQTALLEQLATLDQLMELPYPDPQKVADKANQTALALDTWIKVLDARTPSFQTEDLREFLVGIATEPKPSTSSDQKIASTFDQLTAHWDAVAQLYLALRAWERADLNDLLRSGKSPDDRVWEFHERLGQMAQALGFPNGQDSPGTEAEPDPEANQGTVKAFRDLLKNVESPSSEP